MRYLLLLWIMCAAAIPPVMAEEPAAEEISVEKEIVYRANLGRADDVKLLLDKGASANQIDENGTPVLSLASARSDKEGIVVVKTLLDAGAEINAKDKNGQSALFYAARHGNNEIVQMLLEHKINYYNVDNNGDIARTIAYRENHPEIIETLDNFVKGESRKIAEQYRELSKQLDDQYKAEELLDKKNAEEESQSGDGNKDDDKKTLEAAEHKEDIRDKRDSEAFSQALYDLAFHNCAFQYWSYCQANKQPTELDEGELQVAVESHKEKVTTLSQTMMLEYELTRKYVGRVGTGARKTMFDQLKAMPSKSYRFEQGIGKMGDMNKRCEAIGNSWKDAR